MTDGWQIKEELDTVIEAVVDAGDCGTEPTTVVDWSEGYPELVRVGAGDPTRFQ
jgi:tRNA A37 threonylcarbamoyladenosine synthetase subunit TsaC/SUA5/YrdC